MNAFILRFQEVQKEVHDMAKEKGWWDKPRNRGELLMLAVCELAEAAEGLRHGNPPSDHIPEFSAVEEELADVIIRIMDMSEAHAWRVAEAMKAKMLFNSTRSLMHGGKKF